MDNNLEAIPASKGDVIRLHAKLDDLSTSVTELKTTVTLTPPQKRPCDDLREHLREHKDGAKQWRGSFIGSVVNFIFWLITIGLTAVATAYWGKKP